MSGRMFTDGVNFKLWKVCTTLVQIRECKWPTYKETFSAKKVELIYLVNCESAVESTSVQNVKEKKKAWHRKKWFDQLCTNANPSLHCLLHFAFLHFACLHFACLHFAFLHFHLLLPTKWKNHFEKLRIQSFYSFQSFKFFCWIYSSRSFEYNCTSRKPREACGWDFWNGWSPELRRLRNHPLHSLPVTLRCPWESISLP